MTLLEMKKRVLELIEEINPDSELLTDDPDIQSKINITIDMINKELSRFKKISANKVLNVKENDKVEFKDIDSQIYQLDIVRGAEYELRANGTIINVLGDGELDIDYFKYPKTIDEDTKEDYVFELSDDALGIMPLGVAGDLLKSDPSTQYGKTYSDRYEMMLQRLDSRNVMGSIYLEGGILDEL